MDQRTSPGKRVFAVVLVAFLLPYAPLNSWAQANQGAGEVKASIPAGKVDRPGASEPTNVGVAVLWDDMITTAPAGRVRIGLNDGSILNVGSDASIRVVKHDAASQQSDLTLTFGQMRAVTKLDKPNASFTVRTNTAVLGVIGTDFWVQALPNLTRVIVFSGAVRITNLAGLGAVMVGAGQQVTVPAGQMPSAPSSPTEAEYQEAIEDTDVGEPLPMPPGPRAKSGRRAWPWILVAAGAAATVIAIVVAKDDSEAGQVH